MMADISWIGERLQAQQKRIEMLDAENTRLRAALQALVAKDPPVTKCWHCGAQGVWTYLGDAALWGAPSVHMAHEPDCPVATARVLISQAQKP